MKLGDFGLTMSMKQEVAISPVGTVEYMAPEVGTPCFPLHSASVVVPIMRVFLYAAKVGTCFRMVSEFQTSPQSK